MTRILQLTDLHVFSTPGTRLKGIPTRESLQDVVGFIHRHEPAFDHVIVTGDHTHDEMPESYAAVAEILSPWSDRLWRVPGNHDDRALLGGLIPDRSEESDFVTFQFDAGDWCLIGLDTHVPGEVSGDISESQIEWLQKLLTSSSARRVGLFFHHPPVDVNSVWMDAIGLNHRERLCRVVESDHRIRLICCGHVHHEFQAQLGMAKVFTTPSTGIQFEPIGDTPSFANSAPGYRIVELHGDTFETRVVRLPDVHYQLVQD